MKMIGIVLLNGADPRRWLEKGQNGARHRQENPSSDNMEKKEELK